MPQTRRSASVSATFRARIQGLRVGRIDAPARRRAAASEPRHLRGRSAAPPRRRCSPRFDARRAPRAPGYAVKPAADAAIASHALRQPHRGRRPRPGGPECAHPARRIRGEAAPVHLAHARIETGEYPLRAAADRLDRQRLEAGRPAPPASPAPNASPCATATLIRTPVKEPGPTPATMPASCASAPRPRRARHPPCPGSAGHGRGRSPADARHQCRAR